MAVPIWKDYFVNLGSVASQYFRLRVGGNTIYQGRAYRAASSGTLYVRINDICADYMAQAVPALNTTSAPSARFPMSFVVQKSSNGSSWTNVETVDFNDDWSYDTSFDPSTKGMSFPITGRVDLRQRIVQTRYNNTSVTAVANYGGGTTQNVSLSVLTSTDLSAFWNALSAAGQGRVEFRCDTYATYSGKTLKSVTIGLTTYTVTTKCVKYALFYKNPFGGYDSLLIEGNARKRRSVSRDTFTADYNNARNTREEWVFQNENTEAWTLHTGLLTDEESARMPYLLESTDIYFVDLDVLSYIPAVIVTDSYDIQTFKSNGRTMTDYGFDIRIAQKQYRR